MKKKKKKRVRNKARVGRTKKASRKAFRKKSTTNRDKQVAIRRAIKNRKRKAAVNCSRSARRKGAVKCDCCTNGQIIRYYLNRPKGMTVDHIIPISKGGKHCLKNFQYMSAKENIKKGSKLL